MGEYLLGLVDLQGVLSVIVATSDGLIVATAGLDGDDAETMAAAASALARRILERGERRGTAAVAAGSLHLVVGDELMLAALTETDVPAGELHQTMGETLAGVAAALHAGDGLA